MEGITMTAFDTFLSSVFLAILYSARSNAATWPSPSTYATHSIRDLGKGLNVETFHPISDYKTFGEGLDVPHVLSEATHEDQVVSFVASQLNIDKSNVFYKSGVDTQGHKLGYVKQSYNGIHFVNSVANVAFQNNKAVAFGHSFVDTKNIAPSKPSVDVQSVIAKTEETLGGKKSDAEPTLQYLAREDGSVALVHAFQVANEEVGTWYESYVDAHSGELLSVADFVAHASYKVIPAWKQSIPNGLEIVNNPVDFSSSRFGWHSTDNVTFTNTTEGNNAVAFKDSSTTVQSSSGLNFIYTYDPSVDPTGGQNLDAARTNAFYLANTYHDVLYKYGFTEALFNFQQNNFGSGGQGDDPVLISVQDPEDTNNAFFYTLPDGQPGGCRLHLFTYTNPRRDSAVQNDIPIHEFTHGLTNRMTGGGTALCLQTLEASGMGEGWSDAVADWFIQSNSSTVRDTVMGGWIVNNPAGARSHPYSTSPTVNPLRYSSIAQLNEVHAIGEVWANMLHNVYAALVARHGFSYKARTNSGTSEGNVVFLRLLVTALTLQPCNPTLPTARDAWIQADQNLYKGANKCLLWRTFASRGLGVGAAGYRDSTSVPAGC
ncbi:hypothetical protein VNI00_012585 [Paramarasmius palmivorus]|uniref:Extracellular metalloproteinase n=1 Tax=Paramarasmius palmivorus TaxID=297713 RepID=A0AAW0C6F3_9AGAR